MKKQLRYITALLLLFTAGCTGKDLYHASGRETRQLIRSFSRAGTLSLTMREDHEGYELIHTMTSAAACRDTLADLKGIPVRVTAASAVTPSVRLVFRSDGDELELQTDGSVLALTGSFFAADDALLKAILDDIPARADETRIRHKEMRFSVKRPPLPAVEVLPEGFIFSNDAIRLKIIRKTDGTTAARYLSDEIASCSEEIEFASPPRPVLLGESKCIYGTRFDVLADDGTATCFISAAYDADQVMMAVTAVCPGDSRKEATACLNSLFSTIITESMYP